MIEDNIILISYVLACFTGVACLTLVLILHSKGNSDGRALYRAMTLFVINFSMISITYLVMQYVFIIDTNMGVGKAVRALDVIIYTALPLTFAFLSYCLIKNQALRRLLSTVCCIVIIRAVWDVCENIFFKNKYYEFSGGNTLVICAVYLVVSLVTMVLDVMVLRAICKSTLSNVHKKYMLICGITVILIDINTAIWEIVTMTGIDSSKCIFMNIDLLGIYLTALGTACILMICGSELKSIISHVNQRENVDERIEAIALEHGITKREREIMLWVYNGLNNADISEKLFISVNTVKHHVYNIFEKLGVSSRVELISVINRAQSMKKRG